MAIQIPSKPTPAVSRPQRPLSPSKDVLNLAPSMAAVPGGPARRAPSENARPGPVTLPSGKTQASLEAFVRRRPGDERSHGAASLAKPPSARSGLQASKPAPRPALPPSESSSPAQPAPAQQPVKLAGGKRRLGMGRVTMGYPSKKFKTPGS